jgi:hypothetical protein
MTHDDINNVLEIYYNQTEDYDYIADILDLTVLDVANIINDYLKENNHV